MLFFIPFLRLMYRAKKVFILYVMHGLAEERLAVLYDNGNPFTREYKWIFQSK